MQRLPACTETMKYEKQPTVAHLLFSNVSTTRHQQRSQARRRTKGSNAAHPYKLVESQVKVCPGRKGSTCLLKYSRGGGTVRENKVLVSELRYTTPALLRTFLRNTDPHQRVFSAAPALARTILRKKASKFSVVSGRPVTTGQTHYFSNLRK